MICVSFCFFFSSKNRCGPFDYAPPPDAARLLQLDDATLLRCCSTTPDAEAPRFVAELREMLLWLVVHPTYARVFPRTEQVQGQEQGQEQGQGQQGQMPIVCRREASGAACRAWNWTCAGRAVP